MVEGGNTQLPCRRVGRLQDVMAAKTFMLEAKVTHTDSKKPNFSRAWDPEHQ